MKKGKENGGNRELWKLPKSIMVYEGSKKKISTHVARPSIFHNLGNNIRNNVLRFVLRRSPVVLLDQALTEKVGKAPKKSEIVRHGHKRYNEGVQDTIEKLQEKGFWLDEVL